LLEINVQHVSQIWAHISPFSAKIISRAIQFSHAILLGGVIVLQFP
jgi:hypothetical protein